MIPRRIASLQPTSTEILFALGLGKRIVARSHECTYPRAALAKPVVVTSAFDPGAMTQAEIDAAVRRASERGEPLYRVDWEKLNALAPDVVFTQSLCNVCAITPRDLRGVRAARMVSLHAHDLAGLYRDIVISGRATGKSREAARLVGKLKARVQAIRQRVRGAKRVRMACIEWVDPVWAAGHWVPEMARMAGALEVLGRAGEPSRTIAWDEVVRARPERIVVIACGLSLERSLREAKALTKRPGWGDLPAVREGHVYVADGPAYFNGSGPRVVEGIEILAAVAHPDRVKRKAGYERL